MCSSCWRALNVAIDVLPDPKARSALRSGKRALGLSAQSMQMSRGNESHQRREGAACLEFQRLLSKDVLIDEQGVVCVGVPVGYKPDWPNDDPLVSFWRVSRLQPSPGRSIGRAHAHAHGRGCVDKDRTCAEHVEIGAVEEAAATTATAAGSDACNTAQFLASCSRMPCASLHASEEGADAPARLFPATGAAGAVRGTAA